MKRHPRSNLVRSACAVLWVAAGVAQAQILPPLYVGNSKSVTNALGWNLPGCFCSPETACWVEIREVGPGIVPPDPATGAGHSNNPLVRESYMGKNTIGVNPGKFSEKFDNRLEDGKMYFARVFDAPTPAAALYYANSAAFTDVAPELRSSVTSVEVLMGDLRLKSGEPDLDSDGDGIPDEMENNVTGTLPNSPDSDGDGWGDYYEVVKGGPLNANERNDIDLWLEAATVSWWTIPGVFYRLGYYQQADIPDDYSEVWSGTATETNLAADVEDVAVDPKGFFRVWAVPSSP